MIRMARLLRSIKKPRWSWNEKPGRIDGEAIPADTLRDLETDHNRLSFWIIQDDLSDLDTVITAVAAIRDHAERFDYALFDAKVCENLEIKIEDSRGRTPSDRVNSLHLDLIDLSAGKVAKLAKVIYHEGQRQRIQPKAVKERIRRACSTGSIDESRLTKSMKVSLGLIPEEICDSCKRPLSS